MNTTPFSTHTRLLHLALPLIISNISVPLLGIVDTALLGHLPDSQYLAAVAIGSTWIGFLYWAFSFLRMGSSGLTAQAFGRKDQEEIKQVLLRSIMLVALISVLLLSCYPVLIAWTLPWLNGSEAVQQLALSYCSIRIWSLPAVLLVYSISGWLIGRHKTKNILWIVLTTNLCNIILDYVFIYQLGLSSNGAAWASVVAEYAGLLVALRFVLPLPINDFIDRRLLQRDKLFQLFTINRDLFIRTLCLLFCFAFFTATGADISDNTLAANAILMQVVLFASYAMDGFANAIEALSGKLLGEGNQPGFQLAINAGWFWCGTSVMACSFLLYLFEQPIMALFTSQQILISILIDYWPFIIIIPVMAMPSYLMDGLFIGANQSKAMRNTLLAACFIVYLPCFYVLQALQENALLNIELNYILWTSFTLFSLSRSLIQLGFFRQFQKKNSWPKLPP